MIKLLSLYQFYRPDDVASAQQFTGLAEGLATRSFDVETWPANRSCHHQDAIYSTKPVTVNGVLVRRVWRPAFKQHRFLGRILNALWVMGAWKLRALFTRNKPDIVILGTDPIFAVLLALFFRIFWRKTKIVHFCFDLYPEYAIAEGLVKENGLLVRGLKFLLKKAYAACDLIVDIGPCMREKLEKYRIGKPPLTLPLHPEPSRRAPSTGSTKLTVQGEGTTRMVTLTPWSLEEPEMPMDVDLDERKFVFGSDPLLGLLYSGNLSHPHEFRLTLQLARRLKSLAEPIDVSVASSGSQDRHNQDSRSGLRAGSQVPVLAYSARGNRMAELQKAVNPEDNNIRFVPFAPQDRLAARLSAPDVHVVSLKASYAGVAVPSKFFGALAAGRPVLFEGPEVSGIARWIEEFKVGWVLNESNLDQVAEELIRFSQSEKTKAEMFKHCHGVYRDNFSKKAVIDKWEKELRKLLTTNH